MHDTEYKYTHVNFEYRYTHENYDTNDPRQDMRENIEGDCVKALKSECMENVQKDLECS